MLEMAPVCKHCCQQCFDTGAVSNKAAITRIKINKDDFYLRYPKNE